MKKNIKLNKTQEIGRSMVEILGVLAVMGILSIGGIAGYRIAMDKHKANEILNGASQRAMLISAKLLQDENATIDANTLSSFEDDGVEGVKYEPKYTSGETFTLTLSNVEPKICTNIKNIAGTNGNVSVGDCPETTGELVLTYNKDLTDGVTSSSGGDAGETGATCSVGSVTGAGEDTGVLASDGTSHCYCANQGEVYDTINGCQTNTGNCTSYRSCKSGEYCRFSPSDCGDDDRGTGTCTIRYYAGTTNGKYLVSSNTMDWWSASDWCAAHNNMSLIDAEASPFNCSTSSHSCDWSAFTNLDYYWTNKDYGNNCDAWYVNVEREGFYAINRDDNRYAMCE